MKSILAGKLGDRAEIVCRDSLASRPGKRWEKGGVFLKARPGFIHFRRDPFGVKNQAAAFLARTGLQYGTRSRSGGVIEYYTSRGLILRFDLGDSVIRYARRTVRTSEFVPAYEAGGFTTHNWQGSFGIGFRF